MNQQEFLASLVGLDTLKVWPVDKKYAEAPDVEKVMIWTIENRQRHSSLRGAKIKPMFQETLGKSGSNVILGRASVQPELQRVLQPDVEFVLLVSWRLWRLMSPSRKLMLIDHELCHMMKKENRPSSVPHDLEEFSAIFEEYGRDEVLAFHNLSRLLFQQKDSDILEAMNLLERGGVPFDIVDGKIVFGKQT